MRKSNTNPYIKTLKNYLYRHGNNILKKTALLFLALTISFLGAESLLPAGEIALADVFINNSPSGTIEFTLDTNGRAVIPVTLLRTILGPVVKPAILNKITNKKTEFREDDPIISGIILVYNAAALTLNFTVPPRALISRNIGGSYSEPAMTGGTVFAAEPFSAMLGLSAKLIPSFPLDRDLPRTVQSDLALNPSVKLFRFTAEGGFDLTYPAVKILETRKYLISRDFPETGIRAAFGTLESRAVSFQNPLRLVGFSLYREPLISDREKKAFSVINEIILSNSAEVTVAINGAIARRLHLDSGAYLLSELPFTTGLNTVTLQIAEDGQEIRTVTVGVPFDSEILAPGETDFSLNIGLDRETLSLPFSLANFALGLNPYLEVGFDLSLSSDRFLGGAAGLLASPIGNFGLAGSLALAYNAPEKTAYAARFDWRLLFPGSRLLPQLGLSVQYRSPFFAAPGSESQPVEQSSLLLSSQISQALPAGLGNVCVYGNAGLSADTLRQLSFSAGHFIAFSRMAFLSTSIGSSWAVDRPLQTYISVSLSIVSPGTTNFQYRQNLFPATESIDISIPLDENERTRLNGHGFLSNTAEENSQDISLSVLNNNTASKLSAAAFYTADSLSGVKRIAFDLRAALTIVFAGGYLGVTSNPGNAFMFIVPDSALEENTLVFKTNNGLSYISEQGKALLIPALRPYHILSGSIVLPESAPEVRPAPETIRIKPTYHSGTVIKITAAPSLAARGTLVTPQNTVSGGRGGRVFFQRAGSEQAGSTFTDENGIFECYGLEPGTYQIEWSDGNHSTFTINGSGSDMIELGRITAEPPSMMED